MTIVTRQSTRRLPTSRKGNEAFGPSTSKSNASVSSSGSAGKRHAQRQKNGALQADNSKAVKANTPIHSVSEANQSPGNKKVEAWSKYATVSPYPAFISPTSRECQIAYRLLDAEHAETVKENFEEDTSAATYSSVLDGVTVATLSQATSWSNAKRAMASMEQVYGSPFAYSEIMQGGVDKLAAALRPGGMHNRKSKMLTKILEQVKERHGKWDLNHLFDMTDEDAVKELISYDGIGSKSAYCVLSICLKRKAFAVDTHIYRISGLWGWRPKDATPELAQAHLNIRIPDNMKFDLHYLLIVHGRECPACRAGSKGGKICVIQHKIAHLL